MTSADSAMTPVADLSRRYHFSASHRLHVDHFTDEQNDTTFGKCNNPFGHGHNYTIEVTIRGPVDAETGMVIDMVELDDFVQQRVLSRFELQNLNCDARFDNLVPSTENLCRIIWELLEGAGLSRGKLERLRIEETENNFFEFHGTHARKEA